MQRQARCLAILCAVAFVTGARDTSAVTIFSAGMTVPETISQIPEGFDGSVAGSGDFLIPDAREGVVWWVPMNGGDPAKFSQLSGETVLGGLFLPDTGWGEGNGKFLTVGWSPANENVGRIYTYDAEGNASLFSQTTETGTYFSVPRLAPEGFGDLGGNIIVSAQGSGIFSVNPAGDITKFIDAPEGTGHFGLAFAPEGFGTVGGTLLAETNPGNIFSITPEGVRTLFASVPILEEQRGTRQMEFAPEGFLSALGIDGELLLISVAGSVAGGGIYGDVLALDQTGSVVASLRVIDDLEKFDPRGLLFVGNELLISDASDPIVLASTNDFRRGRFANQAPEPEIAFMVAFGLMVIGLHRKALRLSNVGYPLPRLKP